MASPHNSKDDSRRESRSINRFNVINMLSYVVNLAIVYGIGTLSWTGQPNNSELSAKHQTILTPKGTAFSIWAVIFIAQLIWAVWQFLPSQRNSDGVFAVGYRYMVVALVQAGWTLSFSYQVNWLALIFMYAILITLLTIEIQLRGVEKRWKGYLLWQFPFAIHCGWIIAASIVNTNYLLVVYGASATSQIVIASLSLVVLLGAALAFLAQSPVDLTPPLVLVWALGWVYAELQSPMASISASFSENQIHGFQSGAIAGCAVILALTFVKAVVLLVVRGHRPSTISETTAEPAIEQGDKSSGDLETGKTAHHESSSDEED